MTWTRKQSRGRQTRGRDDEGGALQAGLAREKGKGSVEMGREGQTGEGETDKITSAACSQLRFPLWYFPRWCRRCINDILR